MDDKVCIVSPDVVEKHWDLIADRALHVTLAVCAADKPARYVVLVSDFKALCLTLYKLVSADIATADIFLLLLLAGTLAIHCLIRPEFINYLRFPNDTGVYELDERVLPDFHHYPLIEFIESRGEDGCRGAHFVLLRVGGVLYLVSERLKDGLKVCIDDEWCICTILVLAHGAPT